VVAPERRGSGLAGLVCARLAAEARARGIVRLYLLTLDADGYFARHGFRALDRGQAPPEIRACREFRELCPDSATLMCRQLG
ncbi:MAG: GNAT family N-acetyltransferase, partial [Gammaproteobacteria bacterium]|nr:GNAT family N-acetyltransferase [Gammaproteobacteria bacterium]